MLSNKLYDILKFAAQYLLPAMATFYFGVAKIWGLPYSEQIVGTIMAVDVFIGAILGISVIQYNKQMAHLSDFVEPLVPATNDQKMNSFSMSNNTYDILYWVAQIAVPAIGTLYFALSSLWGFPYGEQIVGTIALIDTVFGMLLGINTAQYKQLNSISPA